MISEKFYKILLTNSIFPAIVLVALPLIYIIIVEREKRIKAEIKRTKAEMKRIKAEINLAKEKDERKLDNLLNDMDSFISNTLSTTNASNFVEYDK